MEGNFSDTNNEYELVYIHKDNFLNDDNIYGNFCKMYNSEITEQLEKDFKVRFEALKSNVSSFPVVIPALIKNNKLCALAVVLFETKDKICKIDELVVSDKCRNQGLGQKFLNQLFQVFKNKHEIKTVYVHTLLSYENVRHFYYKLGFEKIGEVKLEPDEDPNLEKFSILAKHLKF